MKRLTLVEKFRDYLYKAERDLWNMPESGYKEYKTDAYMKKEFEKLGYELTVAEGITGFYTVVDTGKVGPTVLVFAELDALYSPQHPDTCNETGCVHACGHSVQCTAMLGLARVLKEEGALDGLSGKIKLCAVPAEEGIELDYRKELVKKGVIKYTTGKAEFISRGFFDDVDLAFMFHTRSTKEVGSDKYDFYLSKGANGLIKKHTTIKGKSTHAGENPYEGVNALNALSLMLSSTNSLRETFREEDYIKFHSIVTKGGDSVNVVPDKIVVESYVRGASVEALCNANKKINRAISASCVANGCSLEISDMMGSQPLVNNDNLCDLASEVFDEISGKGKYLRDGKWFASSTDMGDLSTIIPSLHAYVVCAEGDSHGKDYFISNKENACIKNVKAQYGLIIKLLSDGGQRTKRITENYKPTFSNINKYLDFLNSINYTKEVISYNQDGTITIDC